MESIFGDGSSANTTRWEPEPTRRGTYGILMTCLITLGLCVWTAVHLNLPARDEQPPDRVSTSCLWKKLRSTWPWSTMSWPGQTLRKAAWTVFGLLAPEMVAFAAYRQYKDASSLRHDMRNILSSGDPEGGVGTRKHEWSLTHSYFAGMGGFEIVVDNERNSVFPTRSNGIEREGLRLTPEGLRMFAQHHANLIPDIPLQQIQDKSKGSLFAKVLVCSQASWFCVQCLARFGQRLGISLLELNTFAHAVCALAIYIAWWNKPLDVEEPVQLRVRTHSELETASEMSCDPRLDLKLEWPKRGPSTEMTQILGEFKLVEGRDTSFHIPIFPTFENPLFHTLENSSSENRWKFSTETRLSSLRKLRDIVHMTFHKKPDRHYQARRLGLSDCASIYNEDGESDGLTDRHTRDYILKGFAHPEEPSGPPHIHIEGRDLRRWVLALRVKSRSDQNFELPKKSSPRLLMDRVPDWPQFRGFRQDWLIYLGFSLVGLIYGALHCAAWNAPFPSRLEALLWRVSSVAVSATGFLLFLLYCYELFNPLEDWFRPVSWALYHSGLVWLADLLHPDPNYGMLPEIAWSKAWSRLGYLEMFLFTLRGTLLLVVVYGAGTLLLILRVAFDCLAMVSVVLYCLARVFLVVECFINLTHLPESAYQVPQWTQYLPSIS